MRKILIILMVGVLLSLCVVYSESDTSKRACNHEYEVLSEIYSYVNEGSIVHSVEVLQELVCIHCNNPASGTINYYESHDHSDYQGHHYHSGSYHYYKMACICGNLKWERYSCDGPPCAILFGAPYFEE